MRSRIRFLLKPNGNLVNITTDGDKIYTGQVSANEYYLTVESGVDTWLTNDVVFINFTRPDSKVFQLRATRTDTGWVWVSNGVETDVDISSNSDLVISWTMKRYSSVDGTTLIATRTSQNATVTIYPASGYLPQEIDPEIAEILETDINNLELNKVGRYNVESDELVYLPAEITYDLDGAKSPNNRYYNFEHEVTNYDGTTETVNGVLYATVSNGKQVELLHGENERLYARTIVLSPLSAGDFTEVNKSVYDSLKEIIDELGLVVAEKQDKTDNALNTTNKTVVGAINELKLQEETSYNALNTNKLDKKPNGTDNLINTVGGKINNFYLPEGLQNPAGFYYGGTFGDDGLIIGSSYAPELTGVLIDNLPLSSYIGFSFKFTGTEYIVFDLTLHSGDLIIINGDNEPVSKIDNSEKVLSVAGKIGEVVLDAGDIVADNTDNTLDGVTVKADIDQLDGKFSGLAESLNGGTTGQILAKVSNDNLDLEWVDKPTAPIQEIQVNGVEVEPIGGVVDIPTIAVNGVDYVRDPAKTYLVVKISVDNDEFTLLTGTTGTPNYIAEMGDGNSYTMTSTANIVHTYEKAGMYLITISGSFTNGIVCGVDYNENKNKIIEVYGGSNYPLSIGTYAFQNCTYLTTANIPMATSIENYAFQNCTYLTTANIPMATSIGISTFSGCTYLTTANFPNVTSIGTYAFSGCAYLTTANIPMATSIGISTFRNCNSLKTANFPNATGIGNQAFQNCTYLTTANFPNATGIGNTAFSGCTSLKELTLGNVTTTTASNAFQNVILDKLTITGNPNDTDIARILNLFTTGGGTFSNSATIQHGLQVQKAPTLDNDVTNKLFVETADALKLSLTGGTMSGAIAMGTQKITGLADGVDPADAINKGQLESAIASASGLTIGTLASPSTVQVLSTQEASDSFANFDIVIRTQTDFNTLVASATWLDAKTVAFIGNGGSLKFERGINSNGILIPSTVKQIVGINQPIISFSQFTYNATTSKALLYYDDFTIGDGYFIKGMTVESTADSTTTDVRAFAYFRNMYDCKAFTEVTTGLSCGFDYCKNIFNCVSSANLGTGGDGGRAFKNCDNIVGCYGFGGGATTGLGFVNCSQLVNCKATGFSANTTFGYGYMDCSYGSNNINDASSNGATTGTMTKWSTETND